MMRAWKITIEVWPHSTGAGKDADQKAAGERVQKHIVNARDIEEALGMAKCIVAGIRSNPAVWEAPIKGIVADG